MIALSLWQPWADLVATGRKGIENRPWTTKVRGSVLVHASQGFGTWPPPAAWQLMTAKAGVKLDELPDPKACRRGGIVGMVEIVDCVDRSNDPWFCGPFGFVLRNARPLPFVACRGRQRFFYPEEAALAELRRLAPGAVP